MEREADSKRGGASPVAGGEGLTVGLGLRLGLAEELLGSSSSAATFLEICPENYVGVGGRRARVLASARERWPILCHGLCGDFAGLAPLNLELLGGIKGLLREVGAPWYSDHLCWTQVGGAELHELVAMPFTEASVRRAARRLREVAEVLEVPIAVENVSAYGHAVSPEMDEASFVRAVVEEAGCYLLLDVNNVYVNSVNFGFDARAYIDALPLERVIQLHVAGHDTEGEDMLLDTHAAAIVDPVYALLDYTLRRMPHSAPVLLERDGNFPPLAELEAELRRLAEIMEGARG